MSPSKKQNISGIVLESTGDMVVQSTPKTVQPVRKEHLNLKHTSITKGIRKHGKATTVRDDYLIIMSLKYSSDPFSLKDKYDRMLWDE